MAQYGTLKDYRLSDPAEDIRGSHLYGLNDEKLGKIDDVIFDHPTAQISYVVIDTGGWLSTKKFIVPAQHMRASAKHKDDFVIDLSKKQIESFPPYNETDLESDQLWSDYEQRYRAQWEADPVMHRKGTDRDITPTTYQMEGKQSSERAAEATHGGSTLGAAPGGSDLSDKEEDTELDESGYAAGTDSVVIEDNAMGIGPRWDRFQERLRERRKDAINARLDDELRRAS
jgi:sporulation protein YlmC with PRC-barrel domain